MASAASRGSQVRCCSSVAQRSSALMTSVFCTSTSTPTDGSTRESSSTTRTEWKNVPPPPPSRSGTSTPIRPISNSRVSSAGSMRAVSSMTRARGAELLQGELAHALPEQSLVLGERGQGRGPIDSRRGHGESSRMGLAGPAGRARPGVEREQSRTGNASNRDAIITLANDQARVSECCRLPDAVGDARRRRGAAVVRARRPDPSRADRSASTAAACAAAGRHCRRRRTSLRRRTRTRRPRSRPSARASTSCAWTRSSPTGRDGRSPTSSPRTSRSWRTASRSPSRPSSSFASTATRRRARRRRARSTRSTPRSPKRAVTTCGCSSSSSTTTTCGSGRAWR